MTHQAPQPDRKESLTSLQQPCNSTAQQLARKLITALETTADLPAAAQPLNKALEKLGGPATIREKLLSFLHVDASSPSDELLAIYAELAPHLSKHLWTRHLCGPGGEVEADSDLSVQASRDGTQAFLCIDGEKGWRFKNLFTGASQFFPKSQYLGISDTIAFREQLKDARILAHEISPSGNELELHNLSTGKVTAVVGFGRAQWIPPSFSPDGQQAYLLSRSSGPWEIREIFSDRLVFSHPRLGREFGVNYCPATNTPFIRAEVLSQPVLINGATGKLIPLPEEKPLRIKKPSFSADGSVALTIVECENAMYVVDILTGAAREFPERVRTVDDPVVSPDGKEAFVRAAREGGGSMILDLFTLSPAMQSCQDLSGAETPEFAPNSSRAFVRVLDAATVSLVDLRTKRELRDSTHDAPVSVLSPLFFTPDNTEAFALATSFDRWGVFHVYAERFVPFPDGIAEVFEWEPILSRDGRHLIAKLEPSDDAELLLNIRTNSRITFPEGYKLSPDSDIRAVGNSSIIAILEDSHDQDCAFDLTGETIATFNRLVVRGEQGS